VLTVSKHVVLVAMLLKVASNWPLAERCKWAKRGLVLSRVPIGIGIGMSIKCNANYSKYRVYSYKKI
jgi:hypothetical protein